MRRATSSTDSGDPLLHCEPRVEFGEKPPGPVIDRHFPLEQMVEARGYAETGQKLGNIVVTVAQWRPLKPTHVGVLGLEQRGSR